MKTIQVKSTKELQELIEKEMKTQGLNANLNHLDISLLTDLSHLFFYSQFNGDISHWNTSNVTNMNRMFDESKFNGDISQWNVSNVAIMKEIFSESKFNQDLSSWKPINLEDSTNVFDDSICPLPHWANCQTNEEIRIKIEAYKIHQEKTKLENALSDEIKYSQKLKV